MAVGNSKLASSIDLSFVVCVPSNVRSLVLFLGFVCGFVPMFGCRCRGKRIDWLLGVRRRRWNRAAQQLDITSKALGLWFFVERVVAKLGEIKLKQIQQLNTADSPLLIRKHKELLNWMMRTFQLDTYGLTWAQFFKGVGIGGLAVWLLMRWSLYYMPGLWICFSCWIYFGYLSWKRVMLVLLDSDTADRVFCNL